MREGKAATDLENAGAVPAPGVVAVPVPVDVDIVEDSDVDVEALLSLDASRDPRTPATTAIIATNPNAMAPTVRQNLFLVVPGVLCHRAAFADSSSLVSGAADGVWA